MRLSPISVHESAHATVGERLGLPATSITVVPSKIYGGEVNFGKYPVTQSNSPIAKLRERLRIDGLVALSGPCGEHEYTHEPIHEILTRNAAGDRRQARDAATGYAFTLPTWTADTRRRVFDGWLEETRDLVRANWAVIMVLAGKLSLNGTLAACDVARIIALADRVVA